MVLYSFQYTRDIFFGYRASLFCKIRQSGSRVYYGHPQNRSTHHRSMNLSNLVLVLGANDIVDVNLSSFSNGMAMVYSGQFFMEAFVQW